MQLANARRWAASHFPEVAQRFAHSRPASERPIRIGYLSADFREHAVAHLTAELFERHDRQRFEIFGYSMGPDDANAMRRRIEGGVDHFVDVKDLSNAEAAARIHHDGIDILVDLMGHTGRARTMIAAQRPAPIAVNWLGFPGTMGAAFIDYILVDAVVVPPEHQPFFAEKLVHLPHCYQANDTQRPIGATPTRAECGLPDQAFVFCCFNNEYKLTPRFFAIWMRLLAAVPGSILWLLGTDAMKRNLAREAAARGIDPARLIFAGRQPLEDHLARHRLADLFLDTLPYNAHTTASDALWTGLPVLTLLGEGFPGRVAASLLGAIGLPELVTRSEEDYENMAVKLATEPLMLRGMRERLAANRLTAPLFDSAGFARRIERAYAEMWRRWRAGEAPAAFAVADDGS
jgi:predicted O-linked N-acetylglucosamine transferase (SPINDLY family)